MKTLILFLIMLISISVFSQERKFQKVCKKNTVESYEKFINKYPNSEFTEKADYKKAELVNTSSGYEYFLKKYPFGEFSDKAESCLCKLEYFKIEKSTKIELCKAYLERFSYCEPYYDLASEKLVILEFEEAKAENIIESYDLFFNKYPEYFDKYYQKAINHLKVDINNCDQLISKHPKSSLVQRIIEEIDFNSAKSSNSISAYNNFIQKYPNSRYKYEASRRITEFNVFVIDGKRFYIKQISVMYMDTVEIFEGYKYIIEGQPLRESWSFYVVNPGYLYCKVLLEIKSLKSDFSLSGRDIKLLSSSEELECVNWGFYSQEQSKYSFEQYPPTTVFNNLKSKTTYYYYFVYIIKEEKKLLEDFRFTFRGVIIEI